MRRRGRPRVGGSSSATAGARSSKGDAGSSKPPDNGGGGGGGGGRSGEIAGPERSGTVMGLNVQELHGRQASPVGTASGATPGTAQLGRSLSAQLWRFRKGHGFARHHVRRRRGVCLSAGGTNRGSKHGRIDSA